LVNQKYFAGLICSKLCSLEKLRLDTFNRVYVCWISKGKHAIKCFFNPAQGIGGSLMVWAFASKLGTGTLIFINSIINGDKNQ